MNYVFRPIDRWPRKMTPIHARKGSPFKIPGKQERDAAGNTRYTVSKSTPLSQTYTDLDKELRFLGVRADVVIQVALKERDIRLDGRPRADSRRPEHPGVILTFTATIDGKTTPLSFACDDCQQWEDNLRAIVKTLEHLRGADRYGVTKSGEQYRGWNALPPAIITPQTMNVEEAAQFISNQIGTGSGYPKIVEGVDAFRWSYREAAKRWHPDNFQGVQHPEWNKLQQAKEVLDKHHGL